MLPAATDIHGRGSLDRLGVVDATKRTDEHLLDDVDRDIIHLLRVDGRLSFTEIGRRLGFAEPTIRQRYNRLVSLEILYVAGMYDETMSGGIAAHVGIHVAEVPVAEVAKEIADHPSVKYVACALGYYDIILDIIAEDAQELGRIVLQDLRRIRGISHLETLTVLEVLRDTYTWQGFREPLPLNRAGRLFGGKNRPE